MNNLDVMESIIREVNAAVLSRRVRKGELLDMFGVLVQHIQAQRNKVASGNDLLAQSRLFVEAYIEAQQHKASIHGERHAVDYMKQVDQYLENGY